MKDVSIRKVKVDDITTIHPIVFDPEILAHCLRKLEKSNPKTIDLIRIIVIKKLFEELSYPPIHINEIIHWFEESTDTKFTREEVKILLRYVELYMPEQYRSPKETINYLIKNCSLVSPSSYEFSRWKNDLLLFEENRRQQQQRQHTSFSDTSSLSYQSSSPSHPIAKHSSSVDDNIFISAMSRMYKFFSGHCLPHFHSSKIVATDQSHDLSTQHIAMTPQSIQFRQEKQFQNDSLFSEISVQMRKRRYSV